jgi:glycerol-1-phosphate dehydrogenase [NAD(P)+]
METHMASFDPDPAQFPALMEHVRQWPGAEEYPDLELRRVDVAPDAFAHMGDVLAEVAPGAREVLLVQDTTEIARGGEPLKPWFAGVLADAGYEVRTLELPPGEDGLLHADLHTLEEVRPHLRSGVPVVSLGSGTITDLAKHACYLFEQETGERLPLVFCPTAMSVLAYVANMAVLSKDGVKRTWPSRLSDALVFDVETLTAAPRHMTLAGFGDLAPVFSSFADWYLGDQLGLARYFEPSYRIFDDVRSNFASAAPQIRDSTPEGMATLARMAVLGGLSASVVGESAPLSGYEHVQGHMLDMGAAHFGRGQASHGAQVAVALIPHLIGFSILLDELDPVTLDLDACYPSPDVMERRVRDTFAELDPSGAMGAECWSDYSKKLAAWTAARPRFEAMLADWPAQRDHLRSLLTPPEHAVEMLASAGVPVRYGDLLPPISDDEGRWAFENAHLMRNRFSAGDLYFLLGWLDEGFAERVMARRDELVAAAEARSSVG